MSSPEFSNDPGEREEWQRQELALRAERHGRAPGNDQQDVAPATYRLIDRALRERPDEPPENFAAQTAALVRSVPRRALGDRLELWLQRALLVALALAAAVALYWMRDPVLAGLASVRGAAWIYAVAVCIGVSHAMQHFAQRRTKKT